MSLYTDNDILNADDLSQIDSEVAEVAEAQEINIDGRPGIIRQTWAEAKSKLLQSQQVYSVSFWGGSNVLNTGSFLGNQSRNGAGQIVASSPYTADYSSLQLWLAHLALWKLYAAASNRSTVERFSTKADRYRQEQERLWEVFASNGIPIVYSPLECPGAIHSLAGGIWSDANLTTTTAGSDPASSYDVAITYVDQSRYVGATAKNNGESGPSAMLTRYLNTGERLQITLDGLNPPNGTAQRTVDGSYSSLNASGWNVYAAPSGKVLTLQNTSPIPITTATYTFSAVPGNTGPTLMAGQVADVSMPVTRLFFRG